VLQQACEQSRNVVRTCRHFGISRQAYYRWKRRYDAHGAAGMEMRWRRARTHRVSRH
jgi:transposase-like protein